MTRPDAINSLNAVGQSGSLIRSRNPQEQQECYAQCIASYARRQKDRSLYPGDHFSHLAKFIVDSGRPRAAIAKAQQQGDAETPVFIHSLKPGASDDRTLLEMPPDVDDETLLTLPKPEPDCGNLVFMRGQTSARWIKAIGARYLVDPELFRRHVDFPQTQTGYCTQQSLPSTGVGILKLRLADIFTRRVTISQSELQRIRRDEAREIIAYQNQLGRDGIVGETIVRRVSYHDDRTFSLEYAISLYIKRHEKKGWSALAWLDVGKGLAQCPENAWSGATCDPIYLFQPKSRLSSRKDANGAAKSNLKVADGFQSASLLPSLYGPFLNHESMRADPFYAISEILCFAAQSERQYLNHMESLVKNQVYGTQMSTDFAVKNLKHTRENLRTHIQSLEEAVDFIRDRGGTKPEDSAGDEVPRAKQEALLLDFERLLARAKDVSCQCLEGINIITNDTMPEEARKTMAQGQQTKTLTLLAFFYLPMTLTTSVFGMNVAQFDQGPLSIGWPFVAIGASLFFQGLLYAYGKSLRDSVAKWLYPDRWQS